MLPRRPSSLAQMHEAVGIRFAVDGPGRISHTQYTACSYLCPCSRHALPSADSAAVSWRADIAGKCALGLKVLNFTRTMTSFHLVAIVIGALVLSLSVTAIDNFIYSKGLCRSPSSLPCGPFPEFSFNFRLVFEFNHGRCQPPLGM